MAGSNTQSYFLWDAPQHKVARSIYYELEGLEHDEVSNDESEINEIYEQMTVNQLRDYERWLENERLEGRMQVNFALRKT